MIPEYKTIQSFAQEGKQNKQNISRKGISRGSQYKRLLKET